MEGYAQSRCGEHRQVVCTIADSDGLADVDLLQLGDELEELRLTLSVDHLTDISPGQLPVRTDLEVIGIDVVEVKEVLEVITEVGEATAEDGDLKADTLEDMHRPLETVH